MKIISQTDDEMVLQQGDIASLVLSVILMVGAIGVDYYFYFISGVSNILWIGAIIFVIGLIILFVSAALSMDIKKSSDRIFFGKKRVTGSRQATYAISNVLRIEVRKEWRTRTTTNNGSNRNVKQVLLAQTVVVFKDGSELPIDTPHQASGKTMSMGAGTLIPGSGKEVALANRIAAFLGVPFQEIAPSNNDVEISTGAGME